MSQISVEIILIQKDISPSHLERHLVKQDLGHLSIQESLSDSTQIKVNHYPRINGYAILCRDDIFYELGPKVLVYNIMQLFKEHLGENKLKVSIEYIRDYTNSIVDELASDIVEFAEYFKVMNSEGKVEYQPSYSINSLINEGYDSEDDDEEDDDEEHNSEYPNEYFSIFNGDDDEDEDDSDEIFGTYKEKKMKKSYGTSKVVRSEKNAKKTIRQHGIIVTSNKEAMKKDERILKAFLKDFIPGNSRWIKQYRAEMLSRWMDMYVMTKKVAKRISKEYKAENKGKGTQSKEAIIGLARNMFHGYDPFYDPNR